MSPTLSMSYGGSTNLFIGSGAVFDTSSYTFVYVSGQSNGDIAFMKVSLPSGSSLFTYYINDSGTSSNKAIKRISAIQSLL